MNQIFEMNGIDLANYYPEKISCDSVVYVHKRFLKGRKEKLKKTKEDKKGKKEKTIKEKKKTKVDKGQQFNGIFSTDDAKEKNNESVLEQTMQFAKNIVPLVLPPRKERSLSPVYYTVTASKKYKKKTIQPENHENVTYKREQCQKIIESFRNDKTGQKESLSVKETISLSSNTLDEIQINPSLCCSLSDISEKHRMKHERKHKHDLKKFVASESFEAMANEILNTGDSKIKVHLMNESDKNIMAENIRAPIMNAIRECVSELKSVSELNKELYIVKTFINTNTQKLDSISETLVSIEKRLDDHIISSAKAIQSKPKTPSPKVQKSKASTLELLSKDIVHVSDESDIDQQEIISAKRKARAKTAVIQLTPRQKEKQIEISACGEATANILSMSSQMGAKPNKIPARFCWTDAGRKNVN